MTLQDLLGYGQMGSSGQPYGPVHAVGQGGSRRMGSYSGYGNGRPDYMGGGASIPAGTNINMDWFGNNLSWLKDLPSDQLMSIARTAGQNTKAPTPPPPPPSYFNNDWGGMRRNIGMPVNYGQAGAGLGQGLGMGLGGPPRSLFDLFSMFAGGVPGRGY